MKFLRNTSAVIGLLLMLPYALTIPLAMIGLTPSLPEAFGYFGGLFTMLPFGVGVLLVIVGAGNSGKGGAD